MDLDVGDVIHNYVSEIYPPKNKFLMCILSEDWHFLLINTLNRPMYECVELNKDDYAFLKGKSRYVSCSRLFRLTDDNIQNIKRVGSINIDDIHKIYEQIRCSRQLTPYQKQLILNL